MKYDTCELETQFSNFVQFEKCNSSMYFIYYKFFTTLLQNNFLSYANSATQPCFTDRRNARDAKASRPTISLPNSERSHQS